MRYLVSKIWIQGNYYHGVIYCILFNHSEHDKNKRESSRSNWSHFHLNQGISKELGKEGIRVNTVCTRLIVTTFPNTFTATEIRKKSVKLGFLTESIDFRPRISNPLNLPLPAQKTLIGALRCFFANIHEILPKKKIKISSFP